MITEQVVLPRVLAGCRDALREAAKQFRLLDNTGHAAMCDLSADLATKAINEADLGRRPKPPFVLTCYECDNDGTETQEQAEKDGWLRIIEDFDGLSWNYLGLCPLCTREESFGRRQNNESAEDGFPDKHMF